MGGAHKCLVCSKTKKDGVVFSKLVIAITKKLCLFDFFPFFYLHCSHKIKEKTSKRAKGIVIVILREKTGLA